MRSPRCRRSRWGTPRPSQPELLARRRAPRDHEVLRAVEGVELEVGAEGGLGERDRQVAVEVDAVAGEPLVGLDPHVHVEVAVGPPRGPAAPPAGEAQGGAGVDAGRGCRRCRCAPRSCGPRRRRSWHGSLMTWPWPPQRGQTELVTIWPRKLCRTRCTWPTPAHSRQVIGLGAGLGAGGLARLARDRGAHVDGVARAEHGLLEGEVGHHLEVGAAGRPHRAPPPAAAEGAVPTEEGVEDVVDARRPRTRRSPPTPSGPKRS